MSHKRIPLIVSFIIAAFAFIAVACMSISSKPAYEETIAPDYAVEHVSDRIISKLPQSQQPSSLTDTGYRIRTRTLVADASQVPPDMTIEDVYSGSDEDIISRILYQSESSSTIYDFGDENNYITYLDISGDNGKTEHPQDAVFAYDTTQGEMIDTVRYDRENGIAYVPKTFFDQERLSSLDNNQSELQAQTLVRYDLNRVQEAYDQDKSADVVGTNDSIGAISASNTIPVEINTEAGKASKMAQVPQIGNQFAIKLTDASDADLIDIDDISVNINDGAVELNGSADEYIEGSNMPSMSYNAETGDLNVYNVSPMSVMNMSAEVSAYVVPSMASRAALATAGEIADPTDNAYKIGHYGQANATGKTSSDYDATTKTIRRWGPGESVQDFSDITISHLSDKTCAYIISVGSCPKALGSSWTANGSTRWKADCVHVYYPNGSANPPSGGYYKVLDADWNNQTVTIAFFITCNSSGQEGAIVLNFSAPRNGTFTLSKRANANPALGSAWQSNVPNAVFGVYNSRSAAQSGGNSGLVKKLTTNAKGIAEDSFEAGTYYVRELSVPWPYLKTDQIVSFTSKPRSKDKAVVYDDSVPPIQIRKFILPSADSYSESDIMSGSQALLHAKTQVSSDGKTISTTITANADASNITIANSSPSILDDPKSSDVRFNASTKTISPLPVGQSITFAQSVKYGAGWANTAKLATICSISAGPSRADMSLKLHSMSLAGTRYGIYADKACTSKVGESTLDANGIGYYGKKANEYLSSNTTYYIREVAGANGYTVSSDVYPVTTSRNSQVSVSVADSFSTFILTKESGAGKALTDKVSQFTLKGAKYGIFDNKDAAESHDATRVTATLDGRPAIVETDSLGKVTEVALGSGTYYVSELPSAITRPWEYGKVNEFAEPEDIDAEIAKHDFSSKSNGKFLLDETVYTVSMKPGKTTFTTSQENIPVRIQLQKQSTRADLASLSQFSLEGAVFGVYETEAAAKAAPVGNYGQDGFSLSYNGAVAVLYGNKNGNTTVSPDLPLKDYYIKEIRAPKNYKLLGSSTWVLGEKHISDQIIHLSVEDFLSSGKYIDGVLSNTTLVKANEPSDVSVQVQKQANEVPDGMKTPGNAMSLAGARFAIYKSFEDAKADTNRLMFKTDDQAADDNSKTDLITSRDDGWTNKAVELPAEECYWIREIEPPHIISEDPEQNAKNVAESMYVLDSEPVKATFAAPDTTEMTAAKDDAVKPVSITIAKYAMSMDAQGRNLHVGEKDADGVPYNDAYTDSAFAGALFGLFETREQAESAPVTDDVNDISVEQAAYDAGALRVMTSDENGVCGTVDNLKWKSDGYYVKELKAPTSGCYKRNESVLQVGCDKNTANSEHIWISIDNSKISKHFEVDEMPNYYYVKIEKTSTDPSVLANKDNYTLEGIHFGLYKTQAEAEAATFDNPGSPLYNLYTREVEHDDGSIHYEAISGLTGPGVFWAKELIDPNDRPNGFQALSSPIRIEAKLGGIPKYETTPIAPENSAPVANPTTGQLSFKTAKDIDTELGITQKTASRSIPSYFSLVPNGTAAFQKAAYAGRTKLTTSSDGKVHTPICRAYSNGKVAAFGDFSSGEINNKKRTGKMNGTSMASGSWSQGGSTYNRRAVLTPSSLDAAFTVKYVIYGTDMPDAGYWFSTAKFYPRISITFDANGGSGAPATQTKYMGVGLTIPSTKPTKTGYTFQYWALNSSSYINAGQYIGYYDWNMLSQSQNDKVATWVGTPTYYFKPNGTTGGNKVPLTAIWEANKYTVSFNANGGTGASAAKTVTYDASMGTVSKPTRTGYIFQGYYDAASGGTQYYKADGTSARNWNKTSNTTLYAHWTPITYKVQYTATDPNASLAPGMTGTSLTSNETYDKEGTLKSGIYHKFGYVSKAWKYTADDGSTKILTPGTNKLLNLTTTNGKTVVLTAVWDLNEYYVKFNDGLSAQWGPAPVVESGTNPDTGTPWSLGYQQKLYYDDYATDGISSDTLTRVRYSHPYFAFKYWLDADGNKYEDMQAVKNLAAPNQVKELTGYWYPSLDYGVDCEANIIPNQPIGGITIQKTVKSTGADPSALNDLSGVVFELFADESCIQSLSTSATDEKGVATFSDVETNKTYYVKEKSIPERLSSVMQISDEAKQVKAGTSTSYEFVNESKQISLHITKSPSQRAISSISSSILNNIPPVGAKFAIYATEQDARNDENRLQFYDENGHAATVATVSSTTDVNGIKCATATLAGLPYQDLWISELAAADLGKHEYIKSKDPVFISKDDTELSNGRANVFLGLSNDMPFLPTFEASKEISDIDLSRLPEALHDEATSLLDGITYALYLDRDDAAARSSEYIELVNVGNSSAVLSNLPMGTYYLIEWSLPEAAQKAGISISDKVTAVEVSDTEDAPDTSMFDSLVTKKMYIHKVDAETKEPIAGVIFDIYMDETKSELLCSTTATDAQGIAVSDSDLLPGRSYFVQERYDSMPPEYNGQGVGNDNSWSGWIELALSDTVESAFTVENTKNNDTGSIEVRKASNTGADVTGAVFAAYDSTGVLYREMAVDENGIARIDDIPVGAYTIREISAPYMHAMTPDGSDAPTFEGTVRPNETWAVNNGEPVMNYQGYVKVHKESAVPEITDAMPEVYSLAGAVYSLYPIENGNPVATPLSITMTTDENGECEPVAVPLGSYKVVETTEPVNFSTLEDQKEFYIEVTSENASVDSACISESKDTPAVEPLSNFLVEKRSSETYATSDGSPQGATSMENTKFAIEYTPRQATDYTDAVSADKTRKWVIATDVDGRATFNENSIIKEESDELYRDADGNAVLPVGTIVVREIVPPVGYTLGKAPTAAYRFNGASQKFEELFADTDEVKEWEGNPIFTAANDIYRADISFNKVDAYDKNKVMSNIPFALTMLDDNGEAIERHLIATDDNGNFSSATGALDPVNDNDKWIPGDVENGSVDASFAPSNSRIWFSGSSTDVTPSIDKGALIYGDYELREYRKDDTQHYQSLEPIYFSVRGDNDKSWIEINGQKIENGNLTEAIGEIENHSIHIADTELLDTVSKTHVMGKDSLLATDTISYADATVGEKYIFEVTAYDMDTKEPITKTFEDVDGTVVDVQAGGSCTLTAESTEGNIPIDISFEGYDVATRKIGLVAKVYHNGYLSDEHNTDLTDEDESISFADIGTTAIDADTTQHIGFSDGHIDIVDTIDYTNLVPGSEYTAKGVLMDKATGIELRDANGAVVESQTVFAPMERNGQVEVRFSFDALSNKDITAVAFEEVYLNGEVVAEHKDIDDTVQTVVYPSVQTLAKDKSTNLFQGNAEGDKIEISDTLSFDNLIAGETYEAHGFLYTLDAENNKTVIDGTQVDMEFAPETISGNIEMSFEIDANIAYGRRILVGEEIWSKGKIIARHDDISFTDQTLSYPSISTTATDVISGLHIGNGESARQIADTVHMEGLKAGESYRIDGIVMGRNADGVIVSTEVRASETFVAVSAVENHKLVFDLPVDFPSDNAVVFEYLSSENGEHLLAKHEDANDENQTVHYPKIKTLALHPDGGTHVGSNIDNKIVDTVFYENLLPGYEYVVTGMLVDKGTGEFVNNAEGTSPISSSVSFTPDMSSGTIDIPFDVNGIDTQGKTLVVFEKIFIKHNIGNQEAETLLATHCDIDDDKQSMFYPIIATTARDAVTGAHVGSALADGAVIDTVDYRNLVPGYEYEISGILMDKEAGEALLVDGQPVTASTKFTPDSADGSVQVEFPPVPADVTKDKAIVVFEKIYLAQIEMAHHEDIEDEAQSVSYPVIATVAKDAKTLLHEGNIDDVDENGKVNIIDTVEYSHIVANEEYTVVGTLMDKATGDAVSSSEVKFIPESVNGSIDVPFEIDADTACGCVLVAFEKLYDANGNEIANHEDIEDEAQTVSYSIITTQAKDKRTQTRAGSIENISIIDTVSYEGLLEGHRYTVFGTLMDKATGTPVLGKDSSEVTGSTEFTASENGIGEVDVEFFSELAEGETLAGKTLVAFERIEETDDEQHRPIAAHEDIDDEEQTIHYPVITRTLARADNGSKVLTRSDAALMSDTITYENLVPGIEYTVDGVMMRKTSEDTLIVGGKAVTERIKFTPDTDSGEIEVVFELDTVSDEIADIVAFERITLNDSLIAEHVDINSEDQSIYGVEDELIETGEEMMITPTGDDLRRLLTISGIALMGMAGLLFVQWRRRR